MPNNAAPIIMDHRVDLYIPSQCICTGTLPQDIRASIIEEVKRQFDDWFGGHAEVSVSGDWRLPDGTIAREQVSDIFSFCSGEALEEHHDDVDRLSMDIANRLTQDRVLRVFDNLKVALWPNTLTDLKPKRNCACQGGVTQAAIGALARPTTIGKADRLSKMLIIQGILRSFNSVDHARKLFCDVLNYDYASSELPTVNWPDGVRQLLLGQPALLADKRGFKIVYLRISTDGLKKAAERQVIQRIFKDDPTFRGLIVVSDQPQRAWEFINVKTHGEDAKRLIFRRMRVGIEAVRTVTERIATLEIADSEEASIRSEELQSRHDKAFDVEAVTKAFFAEVANWYFWALKHARFPKDAPKEKDGRDHVSVIRLITRLIFCWFVKEKGLIPAELFNEKTLSDLLVGFAPGKVTKKESVYYKAILQNLFFATLNTEMGKRDWRRNGQNFMAHSLYRYKDLFARPNEALTLFKNVPFLNGGLFECLDKILGEKAKPIYERIDGFSDRDDSQPTVPDFLFFGEERELDLSEDYGDKKFKKVKVRGLIHTLNHYRFTIEESTPLEEEVALDPELAGKIFENLLAAYNPETGATARKQTGSFYTPRDIVNYMVDEALIAYLKGNLKKDLPNALDLEPRLRHLFSYEEEGNRFTAVETKILITGIDQLKALDPAVGSGAFPMGILHKLVFILGRLDPRNEMWKERQRQRLRDAMATAERIEDSTIRESTLRGLEQQVAGIDEAFEKNTLDYGRKLYLIENCLYGVDIQPIAVQIAKMRFFISLIADQKVDPSAEDLGVRPLPNLETKLVAANTLIGIDKPEQTILRNPQIDALEDELRRVRERHFLARTPATKAKCRDQDKKLRNEIAELLKRDGWGDKTAKLLAGWDPYDQNVSSGFFDPEWIFGIEEGFDVVIGNPPYVLVTKDKFCEEHIRYFHANYSGAQYKIDLFHLFIEKGLTILREGGLLSFIVPNQWFTQKYTQKLRKFVLDNAAIEELVILDELVFEAADVHNAIVLFRSGRPSVAHQVKVKHPITVGSLCNTDPICTQQTEWARNDDCCFETRFHGEKGEFVRRLMSQCRQLGDFTRISLGCQAYNSSKHTPKQIKNRVFHANRRISSEYMEELAGSDVGRYACERKKGMWIKYGPWLHDYRERDWLEGPRILVREIPNKPPYQIPACYVEKSYCNYKTILNVNPSSKTQFSMKYLVGLLNSRLISFLYPYVANKLVAESFPRISVGDLKRLPLCTLTKDSQQKSAHDVIVKLVDRILEAKRRDNSADTSTLEREIDELVYKLYGLTKDEIKIVEEGR